MQLHELLHQREPDPRPRLRAGRRLVHLVEPLEDVGDLIGRDARARSRAPGVAPTSPSVESATCTVPPLGVNLMAFERRLVRIFSTASASNAPRSASTRLDRQADPFALGHRRERGDHAPREGTEIERAWGEVHRPRLELRHVEDLVHEPEQAARVAEGDVEPALDLRVAAGTRAQILQRPDGEGERRAELVRHVGEEAGLRVIERLQLRVPVGELALALAQRRRALIDHAFQLQPRAREGAPRATRTATSEQHA